MLIGEGNMMTLLMHTTLLYQLPNNCYMQLTGLPVSVTHYDPARTLTYRHVTPVLRRALGLASQRRVNSVAPVALPARKSRKRVRHKRHKHQSDKEDVKQSVKQSVAPSTSAQVSRKRLGTRFVIAHRVPQAPESRAVPEPPPLAPPPPPPRQSRARAPTPTLKQKREWVSLDHHAILYSNIHTRCRGLPLSHVLNVVTADLAGAAQLAGDIFKISAPVNLPPRVNNFLPLLVELITAHKRCNYSVLLEHHCPIPPRTRDQTDHVINNPRKRPREDEENGTRGTKRARMLSGTSLLPPTPRQIKVHARLMSSPSPFMESFDLTQRTGVCLTPQVSPRSSVPNHNLQLLMNSPGVSPVKSVSSIKHVSQESDSNRTPHKLYITQDFTSSATTTPLKTPLSALLATQNADILTSGNYVDHAPGIEHMVEPLVSPTTPVSECQPALTSSTRVPKKTRVKLSHIELSELLTYYSTDYQVTSFLISVLQHVVPAEIWGSVHNARVAFNCK